MRYEFRGLIFGGAYTWRGFFSEFYGIMSIQLVNGNHIQLFGVTIGDSFTFQKHIKEICGKVNVKVSILRRILKFFPPAIMTELYTLYYRKLTLHEIKVLEINANVVEKDFRMKEINKKGRKTFPNEGS